MSRYRDVRRLAVSAGQGTIKLNASTHDRSPGGEWRIIDDEGEGSMQMLEMQLEARKVIQCNATPSPAAEPATDLAPVCPLCGLGGGYGGGVGYGACRGGVGTRMGWWLSLMRKPQLPRPELQDLNAKP